MIKKDIKKQSGYTIIETMIAISLFIIIVMIGMDALLNANLLHQKSQSMRSITDSLSFVMEDISRNLRTGYNYHCISDFNNIIAVPKSDTNCWGIAFEYQYGNKNDPNDQWVYYIADGKIFKATEGPYNDSNFTQLTPTEVEIDDINSFFSVFGAEPPVGSNPDLRQPYVTIKLSGEIILKNNVTTPFSLQTSVSQRTIDI